MKSIFLMILFTNMMLFDIISRGIDIIKYSIVFYIKSFWKQVLYFAIQTYRHNRFAVILWSVVSIYAIYEEWNYIGVIVSQVGVFLVMLFSIFVLHEKYNVFNLIFFIVTFLFEIFFYFHAFWIILLNFTFLILGIKNARPLAYIYNWETKYLAFYTKHIVIFKAIQYLILFLVIKIHDMWKYVPIEQGIAVISLLFVASIENLYKDNKKMLSIFKSKFFINLTRKKIPNLTFLSSNQIVKLSSLFMETAILFILVAIFTEKILEFVILTLGLTAVILFTVDTVLLGYILHSSYLYYNKVVKEVVSMLISAVFFSYLAYVTINKLMNGGNSEYTYFSASYNMFSFLLFVSLNICFIKRHLRLYSLQSRSALFENRQRED